MASSGLTEEQKTLVEESWKLVHDLGTDNVGVLLFTNIFKISPGMLQLWSFRNEPDLYNSVVLRWHGANVVNHVGMAVSGLRKPEKMLPLLRILGKKHDNFGILPWHFDVVRGALIMTLRAGLGEKCTPAVEEAWVNTYNIIADVFMAEITTCHKPAQP